MKEILDNFVKTNFNFQQLEFIIRIFVSAVCGAIIGLERRKRFKDAGIRTHLILSIPIILSNSSNTSSNLEIS